MYCVCPYIFLIEEKKGLIVCSFCFGKKLGVGKKSGFFSKWKCQFQTLIGNYRFDNFAMLPLLETKAN